ncbi:hypothetical protein A6R68_07680 [Neotoma lepida]|uniref:Uncharacterized protein n=1 Tax=Neotoma lepida TaxID=56216 RepID=A0A1A6GC12_NEOLE|nr:hypothetical protein A6R68_07680 [Neotoma lepida]
MDLVLKLLLKKLNKPLR